MKKKKSYAHVLSALVLCSWVAVSFSAEPESPAKDDYQIFIQKGSDSTPDFFYAFHKTNITGGTVYAEGPSTLYQELQNNRKEVSLDMFPALTRSASLSDRATKFTRLFVSKNATALLQVLNNEADSQQKKLVASAKVPQKVGGYCTGSLTFFVMQKNDTLSIKVSDQRKCMRSGSGEARLARTAERERKQQQAKEAKEAKTNIAHLRSRIRIGNQERAQDQEHIQYLSTILDLERAAAKTAQQEVSEKKRELGLARKQLQELKKQASSAATNAQSVVEDVMDAGIDQEAALRGKQTEAMELGRQAVLLEQQLVEAQSVAQQAREREQKAKQELEVEQKKSLVKKIGEATKRNIASVKNKFTRASSSGEEDSVVGPTTTNVEPQYPGK